VVRYAILYFVILVVFLALIVGPIVAGKKIQLGLKLPFDILQPTGYSNNDTSSSVTGTCIHGACPPYDDGAGNGGGGEAAEPTSTGDAARLRFRRYMAY
jgi:1,3-beta-glucan synthase